MLGNEREAVPEHPGAEGSKEHDRQHCSERGGRGRVRMVGRLNHDEEFAVRVLRIRNENGVYGCWKARIGICPRVAGVGRRF